MQAVTKSGCEKMLADSDFGGSIGAANTGHHPAAGLPVYDVGHEPAE
jgi:hypothetical protein